MPVTPGIAMISDSYLSRISWMVAAFDTFPPHASNDDGHAQLGENGLNRVGDRMARAAREQERHRLVRLVHDDRAGVSTLAELVGVERLNDDLLLKDRGPRGPISHSHGGVY